MATPADSITIGVSTKGRPTAIYKNFEYFKVRENKNGDVYWRCKMYQSYKCKALFKTSEDRIVSSNDQ